MLSFAQFLLPISATAKGVLFTILFGLAKTCQYGGLTILGVEGYVVMYYGAASRYSGLYILGQAVEGADNIQNLAGMIRVEAVGSISGIQSMEADNANHALRGYAPNGMIAAEGQKGVVIKDGKKILVK